MVISLAAVKKKLYENVNGVWRLCMSIIQIYGAAVGTIILIKYLKEKFKRISNTLVSNLFFF